MSGMSRVIAGVLVSIMLGGPTLVATILLSLAIGPFALALPVLVLWLTVRKMRRIQGQARGPAWRVA